MGRVVVLIEKQKIFFIKRAVRVFERSPNRSAVLAKYDPSEKFRVDVRDTISKDFRDSGGLSGRRDMKTIVSL